MVLVIPSTKFFRSTLFCTFEKIFAVLDQEWRGEESYGSVFPFQQLWKNAIQQEYTWTQNTNTYMSGIDEKAWDEKATITRGISTLKTGKAK